MNVSVSDEISSPHPNNGQVYATLHLRYTGITKKNTQTFDFIFSDPDMQYFNMQVNKL